ncbi:MAG: hypothetical protein HKN82_15055 [Akkermansiaceae bacterium]|nr:hypothetical protein [Akkermansiaceae bacterium]
MALVLAASPAKAFTLSFSNSDFMNSPRFSNVTTYAFDIEIAGGLRSGVFSDPVITNIQYSVRGTLDPTPSGFPAFAFQLDHRFPNSPPITGDQFYALNASAIPGETLRFEVRDDANFEDGLQLDELVELPASFGTGVIFHLNAREEGTGRYHPAFFQLRSDGTGIIQNANNMGGDNPQDGFMGDIDVDFGDEYITDLAFTPAGVTIGVPEPGLPALLVMGGLVLAARRRRVTRP